MNSCSLARIWVLTCVFLVATGQQYFQSPIGKYIADNNYTEIFQKSNDLFGILFTNQHCQQCYYYEQELRQMLSRIYKQEKVAIYRCELSVNQQLQEQLYIKRFPVLHFALPREKGTRTRQTATSAISSFPIYLNNKILTEQAVIETVKKLKYYLNPSMHPYNPAQLILIKENSYISSQQEISNLYGLNSLYQQLPLVVYKSLSQFAEALREDGLQQNQVSQCSIYSKHQKRCISQADDSSIQPQHYFEYLVVERVNQFNEQLYRHYQSLLDQRYVFVAVLDSIFRRQQSQEYIALLTKILHRRQLAAISILWMETQINKEKLQHLGFNKNDRAPLLAHFNLKSRQKTVFGNKQGDVFDQQSLIAFIKSVIKIDEERFIKDWNQQLLKQSLKRLGLHRKLDFLSANSRLQRTNYPTFVFQISYASIQQLEKKELFYEKILNFNYITKRIKRFTSLNGLKRVIRFAGVNEGQIRQKGLYLLEGKETIKITGKELLELKEDNQVESYLRNKFALPQYFWINEDKYEDFLEREGAVAQKPKFKHVVIQI